MKNTKNKKCPMRTTCSCSDCYGCAIGDELDKLHRKIKRLQKKNAHLEQELAEAKARADKAQ